LKVTVVILCVVEFKLVSLFYYSIEEERCPEVDPGYSEVFPKMG
jgi:hypothetical protein